LIDIKAMIDVKEMETENMNTNLFEVNEHFYDKYNPQIRAIVTRILTNANQSRDIDDCVNTVYVGLIEKLQQYNETRGSLGAFVAIVARSTALDYCRSNKRKAGELVGSEKIDFIKEPMEFEEDSEFKMLVEDIIEKLDKKERLLFTMKYILHYPTEEIAESLGIAQSAVDMRVSRLKIKVKKLLQKGGVSI